MNVPAVRLGELPEVERKEHLANVLQRYEHDEKISDLAGELKCSTTTLYRWIIKECPEEWKAVQSARAARQLEEAKELLQNARDNVEINKADKMLRTACWELERLNGRLYGQQQPGMTQAVNIQINIAPRDKTERSA